MSLPVQNSRVGTCPHGCPQGACPICNGMSGGSQLKKTDTVKKNEMSWSECYAAWQKILAKQAKTNPKKDFFANNNSSTINKSNNIFNNITSKLALVSNALWQNTPKPIKTAVNILNNKVFTPIGKIFKNIKLIFNKPVNFIKDSLINISDKLAAIYGEIKNFNEKKISDSIKNITKKLFKLFGLYSTDNEDEDEKRIEEEKRALEMKKIKETLLNINAREEIEDDEN